METPSKLWEVTQVLGDTEPTNSTVEVYAAIIQPKIASTLVRKLNSCAPLVCLGHVKRVRKKIYEDGVQLSIILCLVPCGDREWPSSEVPPEVSELVEEYALRPFVATVPQQEAYSREEWEEQCQLWPTSYHPNAVNLRRGVVDFQNEELNIICEFMRAAIRQSQLAAKVGQPTNGAVIVDPAVGLVISAGHDETGRWINTCGLNELEQRQVNGNCLTKDEGIDQISEGQGSSCWHPLRHAVMVAIERAAEKNAFLKGESRGHPVDCSRVNSKRLRTSELKVNMEKPSNVTQQYLCTGFDVYVTREPCSMCAMALLHQRVHRVFYGISNPEVGALGGLHKLHGKQGLNHRYLVFQVSLSEEDLL